MKNIGELFDFSGQGGHRILPPDGVVVCNQSAGSGRRALSIAIGKELMAMCRWVTGDRVTLDLDAVKSELTIRRVATTDKQVVSWMLSNRAGAKGAAKGITGATTLKITATPMMLSAFGMEDENTPYIPTPVITGASGITFALKKPWTVISRQEQREG